MALIESTRDHRGSPLDVVEHMATTHDWSFARASEDEVTLVVTGKWTDYQVSFTWMSDIEALHLACAFDMRVPELRLSEVQQLIALINEQLWIGHFDLFADEGALVFRHAMIFPDARASAAGKPCSRAAAASVSTKKKT